METCPNELASGSKRTHSEEVDTVPKRARLNADVEPLKTYLRVRPFSSSAEKPDVPFEILPGEVLKAVAPPHSVYHRAFASVTETFTFSKIFDDSTDQEAIFNAVLLSNIERFFHDQSILLFAYGVTGSGKSFTMRGSNKNPGIIPRFADILFKSLSSCQLQYPSHRPTSKNHFESFGYSDIESCRKLILDESKDDSMLENFFKEESCTLDYIDLATTKDDNIQEKTVFNVSEDFLRCSVWCSYYEIYNNDVFDLLLERKKLNVSEDKNGCPYIKDLTHIPVYNSAEIMKVLAVGQKSLRIAATKLNATSSRSHAIFCITLASRTDECEIVTRSMNFCDLAGSERAKKAQGSTKRLKEACGINTSLSNLQRCIDMLRKKGKGNKIKPPYRNCKLTRIFQPYFEGYGIIRMIANISFDTNTYDETINVLRFCSLAQQVVTKQIPNVSRVKIANTLQQGSSVDADLEELSLLLREVEEENVLLEKTAADLDKEHGTLLQEYSDEIQEIQDQHNMYVRELKGNIAEKHNARKKKIYCDVEKLFKIRHADEIRQLQAEIKELTNRKEKSTDVIDTFIKVDNGVIISADSKLYAKVQSALIQIRHLEFVISELEEELKKKLTENESDKENLPSCNHCEDCIEDLLESGDIVQ